ncbi:MAG: hypothetical protein U0136_02995 [Bdellovibrionota bacterium]
MNLEQLLNDFTPERLVALLSDHPPWWVYVVLALIPLSVFFVVRETWCWFFKVNQLRGQVARIEALLQEVIVLQQQAQHRPRNDALDKIIER